MAVVRRLIPSPRAQVFAALTNPETYPHWLVGARDIRDVDVEWPAVGSAFHHRVGLVGPLTVADLSKVLAVEAPRLLRLEVRARPFGRGQATFTLEAAPGDSTIVQLDEVPIGLLAPLTPVLDPVTAFRNRRSLAHLEDFLATARSHRAPA
jgi:uncharacterized protein YndB with AHSA1/START domain